MEEKEKTVIKKKRRTPGNTHVLDEKTLKKFEMKYNVSIHGDMLVLKITYQNFSPCKPIGKKFYVMNDDKTKLTIQPFVVDLWIKKYQNKVSLFRVQNAANRCILDGKEATEEEIAKVLEEK